MDNDDMDSLVSALNDSASVSIGKFDSSVPYSRIAEFKKRGNKSDQQTRRQEQLEHQKRRRAEVQDAVRFVPDPAETEVESEANCTRVSFEKSNRPRFYADKLMLSEWMMEKPENFATDWRMKLCPVGKRCLVATGDNPTAKAYDKAGRFIIAHKSSLASHTVLDCIYSDVDSTYFILDLLCWNGLDVTECQTDFRFQWISDKIGESGADQFHKKWNPYPFVPLPHCDCSVGAMENLMRMEFPFTELDGLLFYHLNTKYLAGSTPLQLWLKAFMTPEILGVVVPDHLGNSPLPNAQFIADFNAELEKKKQRRRGGGRKSLQDQMDLGEEQNQSEIVTID